MLPNASVPSLQPLSMHLSNCSSCLQAHIGAHPQKFPYVLAPQIETHHRIQATPFDLKVFCIPQSSPAHQGTSLKQHCFWRTQQLQSLKSQLPSTIQIQSLRWDLSSCLWNSLLKSASVYQICYVHDRRNCLYSNSLCQRYCKQWVA